MSELRWNVPHSCLRATFATDDNTSKLLLDPLL